MTPTNDTRVGMRKYADALRAERAALLDELDPLADDKTRSATEITARERTRSPGRVTEINTR